MSNHTEATETALRRRLILVDTLVECSVRFSHSTSVQLILQLLAQLFLVQFQLEDLRKDIGEVVEENVSL